MRPSKESVMSLLRSAASAVAALAASPQPPISSSPEADGPKMDTPRPLSRIVLVKTLELLLSFKVHLITITTLLLIFGYISGMEWTSVVTSIGLGRVIIEALVVRKIDAKKDR